MIISDVLKNRAADEQMLIKSAFQFAKRAHHGQKRDSGKPYIIHPLAVARLLDSWKLDAATIAAGLLHDVLEDTPTTKKFIEKKFGKDIAMLVDGVSKLKKIKYNNHTDKQADLLRKMFFVMAKDLRVILIKLADRLHNVSTLRYTSKEKAKRIARETIEIYAPIAERLGMGELKGKLEDYAFSHAHPSEYKKFRAIIKSRYQERVSYLAHIKPKLEKFLRAKNITFLSINSRAKHYYSLYQKLLRKDGNFQQIHDLVAVRIIVPDISDCYETLGVIHNFYRPLPGKIKDFIALPKPNGYQSIHTTVFCENGQIVEMQIRTPEMHRNAEHGIAAHWIYAAQGKPKNFTPNTKNIGWLQWIEKLKNWSEYFTTQSNGTKNDFLESLKIDFLKNRILVFTPEGEVKDLPDGSTPIDFAYSIHTDIGHRCVGAKADGKLISLNRQLKSGELIEVMTSKEPRPSLDWLKFACTNEAQRKIRGWFRKFDRDHNINMGSALLDKELGLIVGKRFKKLPRAKQNEILKLFDCRKSEDLFYLVGKGEITPNKIVKLAFSDKGPESARNAAGAEAETRPYKSLDNTLSDTHGLIRTIGKKYEGFLVRVARCCNPSQTSSTIGYVTKLRGISLHKRECERLSSFDKKRIIHFSEKKRGMMRSVSFQLTLKDRIGLLKDIGSIANQFRVNIQRVHTQSSMHGIATAILTLEIANMEQLEAVLDDLRELKDVIDIQRIT